VQELVAQEPLAVPWRRRRMRAWARKGRRLRSKGFARSRATVNHGRAV